MYEAGETLSTIMSIVKNARNSVIIQTPNGLAPVYWPYTVYGRTAMFDLNYDEEVSSVKKVENNSQVPQHDTAQTS